MDSDGLVEYAVIISSTHTRIYIYIYNMIYYMIIVASRKLGFFNYTESVKAALDKKGF